jgi:hypothetical protein
MSAATQTTSRDEIDARLDEALAESFPASDAPSLTQPRPTDERIDAEAAPRSSDSSSAPPRERRSYPMILLLAGVGWLLSRLARGGVR